MKPILFSFFLAALAPYSLAETAKDAFTAFSSSRVGAQLNVVEIAGMDGKDQPGGWRITADNGAGLVTDYFLKNGRIVGSQPSTVPGGQTSINAGKVRFNSTHAFERANAAAKRAKVSFESANYRLRATSGSYSAWHVQLIGQGGAPVGLVTISSNTGNVLNTQFRALSSSPPVAPLASPAGVGQGLNTAGTAISQGTSRAVGALRGLFAR